MNVVRYGSPTVDIEGGSGAAGPVQAAGARRPSGTYQACWSASPTVSCRRSGCGGCSRSPGSTSPWMLALGLLAARTAAVPVAASGAWFLALPLLAAVALIVALYVLKSTDTLPALRQRRAAAVRALGAGIGLTRGAVTRLHVGTLLAATLIVGALWVPASSGSTTSAASSASSGRPGRWRATTAHGHRVAPWKAPSRALRPESARGRRPTGGPAQRRAVRAVRRRAPAADRRAGGRAVAGAHRPRPGVRDRAAVGPEVSACTRPRARAATGRSSTTGSRATARS